MITFSVITKKRSESDIWRNICYTLAFMKLYDFQQPVTVAERSKACAVFARSEPGIVGSNPTQGMNV
jgi:hypothetical protein